MANKTLFSGKDQVVICKMTGFETITKGVQIFGKEIVGYTKTTF